ncbi:MAG: SDR family oxidoreductase [Bacteroidales bacterium]|nr:SDR family oxidoreductase [Bacteroidales bacterium]MCF8343003.1 SDR family oxidoreductase [Bacteroidales bacterium]MCF8375975.1 SDR family oxidoreductase [Bacteroidales bacterium]MCF8400463.1 SDR family oxidoreductase [Bacteroidales bacterium]
MNAFDLHGKAILITGASSGLGRQSAITLSRYGARLIITGRDQKRLQKTFDLLEGSGHEKIIADLSVEKDVENLTQRISKINGVLYSVGISSIVPAAFLQKEEIEKVFDTNFKSILYLNTALLRQKKFEQAASILFISTISAKYPYVGGSLYVSAKTALEGYARVLALELAKKKIRVNCLRPAFVKGSMLEQTKEELSEEVIKQIDKKQPLGLGEPADVANTVVFFMSDASKWITGTNLVLGGG